MKERIGKKEGKGAGPRRRFSPFAGTTVVTTGDSGSKCYIRLVSRPATLSYVHLDMADSDGAM